MYYIVHKNKDGVYLLDESQSLLWKGDDIKVALSNWKNIKQNYNNDGKLFLVSSEKDSKEKQLLTVIKHY